MNKYFKRVTAFVLCFLMVSGLLSGLSESRKAYADDIVTVKLHYHRGDGNYSGWDVWFWEAGKDGVATPFQDENGEKVATVSLTPGTTSLGFIVRTADWTKDVNKDQFIDVSEMVSGTVHAYVESGVEGYNKVYGDDAVRGIKVSKAKYEGGNTVTVTLTDVSDVDASSAFTIKSKNGEIGVTAVSEDKNTFVYTLTLSEELDYFGEYTVSYKGTDYKITIPSIYSEKFFEDEYTYSGNDLGAVWSKDSTTFKVWAPTATEAKVYLYSGGTAFVSDKIDELTMTKGDRGVWSVTKQGDLNGTYYVYSITVNGASVTVCDPYARATGVNGDRAMVIDLDSTDPKGWDKDKDPNADLNFTDMLIYELHIRDLTVDETSGVTNKGKYLGLVETGTKTEGNVPTALDHIKDLGITHVHILPFYDFGSVDETKTLNRYNWGYDPVNYNVPEGSYSSDPYNGEVRVKEVKEMVKGFHDNGISVVMDVVYNHVYSGAGFCFNKIVPGYFSRISESGVYSNGSGCGNDTASERSMVKKYIVDSVNYWADEYHIDGFRFDLVGLLDTETMNEIITTVHVKHPNVKFYGEGWSMTTSLTKSGYEMATQTNSKLVPELAMFSDNMRDALKGSVFNTTSKGFVQGSDTASVIMKLFKAQTSWTKNPLQTVNYASCHDNNTLIDRITTSTNGSSREDRVKMNNLAAAIYLTSEGVPFMQAGEEMLRSKENPDGSYNSNSYNAGDYVNAIVWSNLEKEEYRKVYEYYKGLIAFRKAHPSLRLTTADEIASCVSDMAGLPERVAGLVIDCSSVKGEKTDGIVLLFNGNDEEQTIELPEGNWNVYVDTDKAGTKALRKVSGTVTVPAISALILTKPEKGLNLGAVLCGAGAVVIAGVVAVFIRKRRK